MAAYQQKYKAKKKRSYGVNTKMNQQKIDDVKAKRNKADYGSGLAATIRDAKRKAEKEAKEK